MDAGGWKSRKAATGASRDGSGTRIQTAKQTKDQRSQKTERRDLQPGPTSGGEESKDRTASDAVRVKRGRTMQEAKPSRTLYELHDEILALEESLEAAATDGERDEILAAYWSGEGGLGAAVEEKVERYVSLIRHLEELGEARKREAGRIRRLGEGDVAQAKKLRDKLLAFLDGTGLGRVETERFSVRAQSVGGKLGIETDPVIPDEWTREKTERVVDLEKIRAALDAGAELPFARFRPRGRKVAIR